jgi:hypothetical protein
MIVLGYDPGGSGANGVALVNGSEVHTGTVDTVSAAVAWARDRLGSNAPDAIGLDTLLSWSTGRSGWRPMDWHLRKRYSAVRNSVISPNRLSGSMAVNGMAFALRARELWPAVTLNETHPKVLVFAMTGQKYAFGPTLTNWLLNMRDVSRCCDIKDSDQCDALLSAVITQRALTQPRAFTDLMALDGTADLLLPAGPVTYWWPREEGTE